MAPGWIKQLIDNERIVGEDFRGKCWVVTFHRGDYDDYTVSILKVFTRRVLAQEFVDFGNRLIEIVTKWETYFEDRYEAIEMSMSEQDFMQFYHVRLTEQEERRMRRLNKIENAIGLSISKYESSSLRLAEVELI